MFSVIIPLYNKAEHIAKAIRSVLDQTFGDLELIIVNDGSTDQSLKVVKQFDDARICVINQENAGVSAARNNGVLAANNEYVAFLDADDWWSRDYLHKMHRLIRSYPDAGLWSSKYYKVKREKEIEANVGLETGFTAGYINYFKAYSKTMWMPITSSSFIINKGVFLNLNGYSVNLKIGEDFELWVRIATRFKIAYLNMPLVYYNQDVETHNRAVGGSKMYKPENHYIFHLGDLEEEEKANPDLKILLDKLRLRALFRYHLHGKYREEKRQVLDCVDFSNQSLAWQLKYKMPLWITRPIFAFRKQLSALKARYL
jgi:glycosyltransferase involved in cell wall biosynthesis